MTLIRKYVSDRKWKGLKIKIGILPFYFVLIEREPSKAFIFYSVKNQNQLKHRINT